MRQHRDTRRVRRWRVVRWRYRSIALFRLDNFPDDGALLQAPKQSDLFFCRIFRVSRIFR